MRCSAGCRWAGEQECSLVDVCTRLEFEKMLRYVRTPVSLFVDVFFYSYERGFKFM
jgi:hypothetical protein